MAGRGPAPAEKRRRSNEPARGDWIDLPPLEVAVLPELPAGEWSDRTRAAWESWGNDPATTQYDSADVQGAVDLAYIYESWVRDPNAALAAEIRQRQDRLGLNPKGKRDLRWRVSAEADAPSATPTPPSKSARRARLSVVK